MLTVAEVQEMQPGDDQNATWINPGFTAVVKKLVSTESKKSGKPMHICTLTGTNGVGEISMTLFTPTVKFNEGDTIEVSGKGLRRTEFNGLDQASVGRETEVRVVKRGSAAAAPQGDEPAPRSEQRRAPSDEPRGGRDESQRPTPINGQTVGMAVNNAVAILIHNATATDGPPSPVDLPKLQRNIEAIAISIITASRRLESGAVKSEDAGEPVDF